MRSVWCSIANDIRVLVDPISFPSFYYRMIARTSIYRHLYWHFLLRKIPSYNKEKFKTEKRNFINEIITYNKKICRIFAHKYCVLIINLSSYNDKRKIQYVFLVLTSNWQFWVINWNEMHSFASSKTWTDMYHQRLW